MDQGFVSILVASFSLLVAFVAGAFALVTARGQERLRHRLDAEEIDRRDQKTAEASAARVYEPLVQSAAELRARLLNIVDRDFLFLERGTARDKRYALQSSAYLVAQYLGWAEAFRVAVLSANREDGQFRVVQERLNSIRRAFATDRLGVAFRLFGTEQRGIGELMFVGGTNPGASPILGYATFVARWEDASFSIWFSTIVEGIEAPLEESKARLSEVVKHLNRLVELLDPDAKFSAGFTHAVGDHEIK